MENNTHLCDAMMNNKLELQLLIFKDKSSIYRVTFEI